MAIASHPGNAVNPTSVSLLDRLKAARPESSDWDRLHGVYLPLIRGWLARIPGLGDESADLAQEVLVVVFREVPRFERRREGSFRAWLRQVTVNKVRSHRRRRRRMPAVGLDPVEGFLDRLADPDGDLAREWDREHDRHVTQRLLAVVQPDFSAATWEAFRRFALDGLPAARVAGELGMTENAVIRAKSRILKRLREEAGELLG
jgi:RNA polymerase sigma-70 factor (ECF subfamily)